jgi:hypothetical protein
MPRDIPDHMTRELVSRFSDVWRKISVHQLERKLTNLGPFSHFVSFAGEPPITCVHTRRVPHNLSSETIIHPATVSKVMVEILKHCCKRQWKFTLASDESWLFHSCCPNGKWSMDPGDCDIAPVRTVAEGTVMVTIMWSSTGFTLWISCWNVKQ